MPNTPEPIDITRSNEYIHTHRAIKERMKRWAIAEINGAHRNDMNANVPLPADPPDIPADNDGFNKARNFYLDNSNAYVFRIEDFERFFLGTDPTNPGLQFTHCMIVVGALMNDDNDPATGALRRERGKQTILIAGCSPLHSDPERFITTTNGRINGPRLQMIATEHPPYGHKVSIISPAFKILDADEIPTYNNVIITEKV